ncbi:cytochrome P450 [Cladochytrium replicatum]|nr:cytochrome P450 [Cladochytrium replicatum]
MIASIVVALVAVLIATVAIIARQRLVKYRPLAHLPTIPYIKSLSFLINAKRPFNERYDDSKQSLTLADRKLHVVWMAWGQPVVTGTSPVLIKELFDINKFAKFDFLLRGTTFFSKLMGRNVATANGDEWLLHRSITRPAFARPLKMDVFVEETRKVLAILQSHAQRSSAKSSSAVIDVYGLMQRLTLSVLGFGIFSFDFESLPPLEAIKTMVDYASMPAGPYVEMYNSIIREIMSPIYIVFPFICHLPIPSIRETWKKVNAFSDLLRGMVEKRKDSIAKLKTEGKSLDPKSMDLLDMMVEAAFEEGATTKWTTENMMHNLFTFFIAGHDTTSNALSCALYHFAKHSDIQAKARDEVNEIFGTPKSFEEALFLGQQDPITHPQLSRLYLINAVIKETMRLFPSAAQPVLRVAAADVNVRIPLGEESGGAVREITIPKGTMAVVDLWGVHHDPDNFEDPEAFKPERWLNSVTPSVDSPESDARTLLWAPFGGGPRICMGMQFSLVEQRVFLLMVLRAFDIEFSEVNRERKLILGPGALLHPVGLELVFKPKWKTA